MTLDGIARTIVGVMPSDFRFPSREVRSWVPTAFSADDLQYRGNHSYRIVGRLGPGGTLASAEAEIAELMGRVSYEGLPDFHQWHPGTVRPLRTEIVGDVSRTLWVMLGAVGLVLLIACANVANLLLVRSEERAHEMSIRTALGAGRGRLVSQLLAESLVIAVVGGAAGVALAYVGVDALRAAAPADLPRLDEVRIDATVLAFTTLVTMGAGLLFGLMPALLVGRSDLQSSLRTENRGGTAGRGRIRVRQLLVVSETALAVMLLIAAGLLLQSFRKLMAVDPGFRAEQVLTASITIPEMRYAEGEDVVGFYETLLPRIRSLPGVMAAGAAVSAPLAGRIGATDVAIEGWASRWQRAGSRLDARAACCHRIPCGRSEGRSRALLPTAPGPFILLSSVNRIGGRNHGTHAWELRATRPPRDPARRRRRLRCARPGGDRAGDGSRRRRRRALQSAGPARGAPVDRVRYGRADGRARGTAAQNAGRDPERGA